MRTHLANATYGVLDYAAYPIGMLIVAPIVLHNLGTARYGVWAVVTATVSMGSMIASGFGDANIQQVASQRSSGEYGALLRTVRSLIGINLVSATVLSFIAWMLVPFVSHRLASSDPVLQRDCIWSLRIACVLIWVRTQESVCISTQRAFERYGAAVRISVLARLLSLAVAAGLTYFFPSITVVVASAALINLLGTLLQFIHLRRLIGFHSIAPAFDRDALKALLSFGAFSWLQAVSGVVVSQTDRLFLGVSLGATAVASYALCTQIAQPIYGVAAAGLHFLFPYLSGRISSSSSDVRKAVLIAFACNVFFVVAGALTLLLFGRRILHMWAGEAIPQSSLSLLPLIVWGFSLLALNVTATYALFALGRVRVVTSLNLAGGLVMLLLMVCLLPRFGTRGMAMARLCYGLITLILYFPLVRHLRMRKHAVPPLPAARPACEES
jgi:O-antigen/teichoic acid export membrane protein